MNTNPLITHIEKHLGKIASSWILQNNEIHVQTVNFVNTPVNSVSTYVTLGLSHHLLAMSNNKTARQELIFTAYDKFDAKMIASMLLTFSNSVLNTHKALLRGSVEYSSDPIIPGIELNCLYASIPVLFEESFDLFNLTTPPTVFIWLIPLHTTEAKFVTGNGWSRFEEILEIKAPDLFDLYRSPII